MRGFQKRVVFLKNPDSALFDEAYFVLRENGGIEASGQDMVREALHILEREGGKGPQKEKGRMGGGARENALGRGFSRGILLGGVAGGLLSALLFLLFALVI